MTWPPVKDACDTRDLITRLQWFFPRMRLAESVWIPATSNFQVPSSIWSEGTDTLDLPPVEKVPVRITNARVEISELLQCRPTLLVWKFMNRSSLVGLPNLARWFIIDPDWFSLVEELEWTLLYESFKDPEHDKRLRQFSRKNLEKLRETVAHRSINVCGNGPSLRAILAQEATGSLNFVCNTAVQSPDLLQHLRPAVIAFANAVFFGPSSFARGILAAAARCVAEYDSVIVTPGGYAQYLIASNYPALAEHTLGLEFGSELNIPTVDRLKVSRSSNVATALMLPLAAALRRKEIDIWGCDGGCADQRSQWSPWKYFAGGEPARDSATRVHPAFFRDRVITDEYYRKYMEHHCDYFETLLTFLEGNGFRIRNRTISSIPALHRRFEELSSQTRTTLAGGT